MSKIAFSSKISSQSLAKVVEISDRLNINPSWLMAVISFETAGTFSPAKTNHIGSVGLIQFTRDKAGVQYKTINGKKYQLADLKAMSFEKQMDVVFEYYKPYIGKINSFIDCYLVTFFPKALNQNADYVLQTSSLSASLIAKQNPIFDPNKDGKITKSEILAYFKKRFGNDFTIVNQPNPNAKVQTAGFGLENPVVMIVIGLAVFFYSVTTFSIL